MHNASFHWEEESKLENKASDSPAKTEGEGSESSPQVLEEGSAVEKKETKKAAYFSLKNLNFQASAGKLTAIVGPVGSGKSSLLAALLGEMPLVRGKVTRHGRVAYVAQTSWIQNGTVRDNILFGLPYDEKQYNRTYIYIYIYKLSEHLKKNMSKRIVLVHVNNLETYIYLGTIESCALKDDLSILPAGDQTEIGERGRTNYPNYSNHPNNFPPMKHNYKHNTHLFHLI